MKLSILDQSPIFPGQTPKQALDKTVQLAQIAENLGYTRFWVTEHHDMDGLAGTVPEILLAYIGSKTRQIRIGSGAVLLPHYKPYKVAETFHLLSTLFPGRIDLGIGRAPGGSAEAMTALSGNFLENVWKMPELINELLHFLHRDFPESHPFANLTSGPLPDLIPEPWLLGTSKKSGKLAAENGTFYAYGEFMSESDGIESLNEYKQNFKSRGSLTQPKTLVTVSVLCAETTKKANELAGLVSGKRQQIQPHHSQDDSERLQKNRTIIGNPQEVKRYLEVVQAKYDTEEIMIHTIAPTSEDRQQSYILIGKEMM